MGNYRLFDVALGQGDIWKLFTSQDHNISVWTTNLQYSACFDSVSSTTQFYDTSSHLRGGSVLNTPAVTTTYSCPPGTYNSQGGLYPVGTCVPCGSGAYANFPGQTNCRLLPTDATNTVGGVAAPQLGYYAGGAVRSRTYTTWMGSTATSVPGNVITTFPGYSSCDPRLIAMDLNRATNDFVAMGTFAFGSPFSVVFWLNDGDSSVNNANVFSFGHNETGGSIRFMHNLNTRYAMWISDTIGMNLASVLSMLDLDANVWYYFGLVWDNVNQKYIDLSLFFFLFEFSNLSSLVMQSV
jgi:hypothetical protein